MQINPGTQIGPYEVHQLLGQGGMAAVYKVWHTDLQRYEAMKMPLSQNRADEFAARFLKESRNAAGLHHPHIAAIYNVSAENAMRYFTMELVEGGDLADLIYRKGRLSLEDTREILQQVAGALDYAHACGVWHRDIKPANILLQKTVNGEYFVKVVDFGISHAAEETGGTRLTKTGMFIGTPEYMSPEQAGSEYKVDHHTDQYSLGVIAYEMLCGVPPFKADGDTSMISVIIKVVRDDPLPPRELVPSLPASANAAIMKALAKNPADRFQTCGEFLTALAESSATKPPTVIPAIEPPSAPATDIFPPKENSYCPRCGKEIADGLAFCPVCEATNFVVPPTMAGTLPDDATKKAIVSPPPGNTFLRNLMLALAGVGVALILLALALRPRRETPVQPRVPVHVIDTKSFPDGSHYSGQMLNGEMDGKGTMTWPNGKKVAAIWDHGQRGKVLSYTPPQPEVKTIDFPDGSHYRGETVEGKLSGHGTKTWRDNSRYEGEFKNDVIDGKGTLYWKGRHLSQDHWTNDKVRKVLSEWKRPGKPENGGSKKHTNQNNNHNHPGHQSGGNKPKPPSPRPGLRPPSAPPKL
jgi:serine/threonine protein kinase